MLERFDLLTPLTRAYGSADRARAALDRALRRAGLDQVPVAVAALTGFVCAQLQAVRAALRRAIDRATAAEDADLPDSKPGGEGTGKT